MILVYNNEDGPDFIYSLDCSAREFCEKMAELADCEPDEVTDEWTIITTEKVIPRTVDEFFA